MDYNITKHIINEIHHQLHGGGFLINEDKTNLLYIHSLLKVVKPADKLKIVRTLNNIFLSHISSSDGAVNQFALRNFLNDQNLTVGLLSYVTDKGANNALEELNKFYQKIYLGYIDKTFFGQNNWFFSKSLLTGNPDLDKEIVKVLKYAIESELKSEDAQEILDLQLNYNKFIEQNMRDFEPLAEDALKKLQSEIPELTENKKIPFHKDAFLITESDILTEGVWDSVKNVGSAISTAVGGMISWVKIQKFMSAIKVLFRPLNSATVKVLTDTLKSMNKLDLEKLHEGGKSNISMIMTQAIMTRTDDVLRNIKAKDDQVHFVLSALSYKLMLRDSQINDLLIKNLSTFIDEKLRDLTDQKDIKGKRIEKNDALNRYVTNRKRPPYRR